MGLFDRRSALELATEYPPANEQAHIDSLIHELRAKVERDYANGRILRDAHPKMHGCVKAEFSVDGGLPPELAVGVFAIPRTFPAWVRFSNATGTVSPDIKPDIRGVAIKLMGVDGQKLLANGTDSPNQDFTLISDSRFLTKDVAEFDGLVKSLMGGRPRTRWFLLTHWRVARNLFGSMRKHGNPLAIRYFSVVPYLLGDSAVKYSLTPREPQETPIPGNPSDDYLREAMAKQLVDGIAVFDFSIQFQKDPYREPIEDPGVTWSEKLSPFRRVGTLTISSQSFESPQRMEFGDNLSFNPWRCLAQHRPLGGISRARQQVYQALSIYRHDRNQAPRVEPTVRDEEWTSLG